MTVPIRIGFIPLVDCAPLVVLHEMGFAREAGLEIVLTREASWSNIRDKLAVGLYEASHLLAPMPLATNLGLAGPRAEIVAPYVLNLNGDVVGAAEPLLAALDIAPGTGPEALLDGLRTGRLGRPAVFGVPFFFSTHHYLLRYWMAAAGVDLDARVRIEVIPPPLMTDAIRAGVIDAFMVGEPWGSFAVDAGAAAIVLTGAEIWKAAPEKVLGLRREWMSDHEEEAAQLLRALLRASQWADNPVNRVTLSELLSRDAYLGLPAELLERALAGTLTLTPRGHQATIERFLVFDTGAATFPWRSQALWFLDQMSRWGHAPDTATTREVVRRTFAPEIYRAALSPVGADLPAANAKVEGALEAPTPAASRNGRMFLGPDRFCDGRVFDPETPVA